MSNLDKESKKIIFGTLIGGVIGIGLLSIFCARKSQKKSPIRAISSTISQMADALEHCKKDAHCAVREVEETIKDNESVISDVFELATVGIELWNKIKHRK